MSPFFPSSSSSALPSSPPLRTRRYSCMMQQRQRNDGYHRAIGAVELRPEDIVSGRGDQNVAASGNARFYRLIDEHSAQYTGAVTKFEKSHVVQTIYCAVAPGRFLKKVTTKPAAAATTTATMNTTTRRGNDSSSRSHVGDDDDDDDDDASSQDRHYIEMTDKEARQKISHALRYRLKTQNNGTTTSTTSTTTTTTTASTAGDDNNSPEGGTHHVQSQRQQADDMNHQKQRQGDSNDDTSCIFTDEELWSVLGHPSIFQSTSSTSLHRLLHLFRMDQQNDSTLQRQPRGQQQQQQQQPTQSLLLPPPNTTTSTAPIPLSLSSPDTFPRESNMTTLQDAFLDVFQSSQQHHGS